MTGSGRFRLTVFEGNSREAAAVHECDLDYWTEYERLKLPGFDGCYSLSLAGLWAEFFEKRQAPVEQSLTGYETIVKFGNTMQLQQTFRVIVEVLKVP